MKNEIRLSFTMSSQSFSKWNPGVIRDIVEHKLQVLIPSLKVELLPIMEEESLGDIYLPERGKNECRS